MRIQVVEYFLRYRRTFRNYITVLIKRGFSIFPINIEFRDGRKREALNLRDLWIYSFGWDKQNAGVAIPSSHHNKTWLIRGNEENGDVVDIFGLEVYKFLCDSSQYLIDIGANIGDSSIYFIENGFKKIIAVEPFPFVYNLLEKNIKENGLMKKVSILNSVCSYERIRIDPNVRGSANIQAKDCTSGIYIDMINLEELVEMFPSDVPINLKVDCEGCEYEIFSKAKDITIQRLNRIQIEYHHGTGTIVSRLRKLGFNVSYTKPRIWKRPGNPDSKIEAGYIYAIKENAVFG